MDNPRSPDAELAAEVEAALDTHPTGGGHSDPLPPPASPPSRADPYLPLLDAALASSAPSSLLHPEDLGRLHTQVQDRGPGFGEGPQILAVLPPAPSISEEGAF